MTKAMKEPREVDQALVEAYLARRALDYLVGFTLSPVLWRKLPGAKSAGRVQSVCLRLIVEREMEIEAFKAQEYWTVKAVFRTPRGQEFRGRDGHPWRQEAAEVRHSRPPPPLNWRSRPRSTANSRWRRSNRSPRRATPGRPS